MYQASTLLEQRLLPLLGSIQGQLGPRGDAARLAQLQQLVSSLNQLSGMLQPPPAAHDQQALGLLQWLQNAGALAAAAAPGAGPPAAQPAAQPAGGAGDAEQMQAMLRRVAGLLKRQEELGAA